MKEIYNLFFYLLILHPIVAYFVWNVLSIYANKIYSFLLIVLTVSYLLIKKSKILFPKYLWLIVYYSVYILGWDYVHGFVQEKGIIVYFTYWNYFNILILMLYVYNQPYNPKIIKNLLRIIPIIIVVASIVSMLQVFVDPYFWSRTASIISYNMIGTYLSRRPSIFGWGDPLNIGLGFIPLVACYIDYLVSNNKKYWGWLVLIGLVSFASNTRYIIGGFLIITFIPIFYQIKRRKVTILSSFVKYSVIIILTSAVLFLILGYNFEEFYNKRLFHEGSVEENTRFKAINTFMYFFPRRPILGNGYRLSDDVAAVSRENGSSRIHVGYLQHWVSYGIIGSILLFSIWFIIWRKLWLIGKRQNYYGGFWSFAIFLWSNLTFPKYSFFYFGIIISLLIAFHVEKFGLVNTFTKNEIKK